ncbi:hypothetical protein VPUCM_2742 [Vibrio parahaemolyticus UCM-V493]|nr:hypothetical protein VPUCM_2742 [Vibrio parahaemolyticus UCM-V493]
MFKSTERNSFLDISKFEILPTQSVMDNFRYRKDSQMSG